jgi:hypothetical protein
MVARSPAGLSGWLRIRIFAPPLRNGSSSLLIIILRPSKLNGPDGSFNALFTVSLNERPASSLARSVMRSRCALSVLLHRSNWASASASLSATRRRSSRSIGSGAASGSSRMSRNHLATSSQSGGAVKPCLWAFREERLRPVEDLEPVLFSALVRLVAARIGRSAVDLAIGTPRLQRSRSDASKTLQQSTSSSFFLLKLVLLGSESKISLIAH